MSMKIDDWEYHSRMLADIAKRNGASMMLFYDPAPKALTGKTVKAINGDGGEVMVMIATLITEAAKASSSITPARLAEEICKIIKFRDFMRENE